MSKILVDKMPEEPRYCPFALMREYIPECEGFNPHYEYGCVLNDGMSCDVYEGNPCEYLAELPKGGE